MTFPKPRGKHARPKSHTVGRTTYALAGSAAIAATPLVASSAARAADTPALLAHNRALVNDFLAGRDDLEAPPVVGGVTCFPRLVRGDVDALDGLLRARYDAAIVPGRFFGLADHFRLGFGQPTGIVAGGLERLGAALDSLR